MKKSLKSLSLLTAFMIFVAGHEAFSQISRFSVNSYQDRGDTLKYRELFPDADTLRKYPLVIFLHGSGERGDDNEAQLKWGVMNFASDLNMQLHPAFVVVPQCPAGQRWANISLGNTGSAIQLQPSPSRPMELLIGLIHSLAKSSRIDTNRIYITGLSMGGYGTYDAIERYPHLFAAAVPVCGGGDVSKADLITHIPIWIFHGAEDPAVDPEYSLEMLTALTKAGAHPGFTQYPETGHFSWIGAYADPFLMEWMFRQHK